MGESGHEKPSKDDLEKGGQHVEDADQHAATGGRASFSEGISHVFSRASEGLSSAFLGAGSAVIDSAKKMGGVGLEETKGAGGQQIKKKGEKKHPERAKEMKKFHKKYQPPHAVREEPKDTNIVGNITKLLPANTFLMFQTLAPLATNDGNCKHTEVIMTSVMLLILVSTCMMVCFTDTMQFNGKVYHGIVTWSGLWNPSFKGDPSFTNLRTYERDLAKFYADRKTYKEAKNLAVIENRPNLVKSPPEPEKPNRSYILGSTYSSGNNQYCLKFTDFLHAVLSGMAFGTLTLLTSPVSTCFYPNISGTVVKTLPLLVGFVISAIFAFSPPARNGIAHPLSPKVASVNDNDQPPDSKGVAHGPQLPPQPPAHNGGAAGGPNHGGKPKDGKPNDGKPNDGKHDDVDDGGNILTHALGKLLNGSNHGAAASHNGHHLEEMKSFATDWLGKYGDRIQHGASKMAHTVVQKVEGELEKDANKLLGPGAGNAIAQLSKEVPLVLQEAAKSPAAQAMLQGLLNAGHDGSHPVLEAAAHAYAQGAKDAALKIHQDIQTATSAPMMTGLQKQSSMALTRANSMLQSAGSSLSSKDVNELYQQAAQALHAAQLSQQISGVPTTLHSAGSEASAMALAAGHAVMQAGYNLPGLPNSPQYHSGDLLKQQTMNLLTQAGMGNHVFPHFSQDSATALVKDMGSLIQQGAKSVSEVHDDLTSRQAALSQGLTAQLQTLYRPGSSIAQDVATLIQNGSQTFNEIQDQVVQGTLSANLTSSVAREAGNILQQGADHGMAGVQDELSKEKAGLVQSMNSFAQPASSLAQDVTSLANQGSQTAINVRDELSKQKSELAQEMQGQLRALSTPATSVAADVAALARQGSEGLNQVHNEVNQKAINDVNSQFVNSLARGMARGMSMKLQQGADLAIAQGLNHVHDELARQQQQHQNAYQPMGSVAVDVASQLFQQGKQTLSGLEESQLPMQQSALAQRMNGTQLQANNAYHPADLVASLLASSQFQQPMQTAQQVVENHIRRLASITPSQTPAQFGAALYNIQPPVSMTINALIDSRPAQQLKGQSSESWRDNGSQRVIEEVVGAAASTSQQNIDRLRETTFQVPTAREVVAQASTMVPSTSQLATLATSEIVAGTISPVRGGRVAANSRAASEEIIDSISEEITSESETEGRGDFKAGPLSLQMQLKRKF